MSAGRKYWTDREWREQFELQGEKCALCPETVGPFIAEHEIPNYYQPGKPSRIICAACDRPKTAKDRKDIARTKRLNGESSNQYTRRKEREAKGERPFFQSRGFQNGKRRARTRDEIMGEQR